MYCFLMQMLIYIFFSCISNMPENILRVSMHVSLCACGLDCVGARGLCFKCPASFYSLNLNHQHHRAAGTNLTSQGTETHHLWCSPHPHLCPTPRSPQLAWELNESLPDTIAPDSVCTVFSFIPRWARSSDLYAVRPAASTDYTKYKEGGGGGVLPAHARRDGPL